MTASTNIMLAVTFTPTCRSRPLAEIDEQPAALAVAAPEASAGPQRNHTASTGLSLYAGAEPYAGSDLSAPARAAASATLAALSAVVASIGSPVTRSRR